MKILIPFLLMSLSTPSWAQLTDEVKATATYYQKEIEKTVGKKIEFKIESKHEYTKEESKRLDYVIRTLGMAMVDIGKEKTWSKPWLAKNISLIIFQNRSGDDQVHLKKEHDKLLITFDLTKTGIRAGEKEVDNIIKSWIPKLGPGSFEFTSKDQEKYYEKEFETWAKAPMDLVMNWDSLRQSPPRASEKLFFLAGQVVKDLTDIMATENLRPKVKILPNKVIVEATDIKEEVVYKLEGKTLKVFSSKHFLETSELHPFSKREEMMKLIF